MNITIKPELQALIPPLAEDERNQLEQNLIADGCREPLVVWTPPGKLATSKELYDLGYGICKDENCKYGINKSQVPLAEWVDGCGNWKCPVCDWGIAPGCIYEDNILIDGHNRLEICERNGIHYKVTHKHFDSMDQAVLWIIDNQVGRRNLPAIDKVPLLERKREILELDAEARHRQLSGTRSNPGEAPKNFTEPATPETSKILASEIGVSRPTYDALRTVSLEGTEELKQAVRDKKVGASTAAEIAHLPEETQREIASQPTRKAIVEEAKKHIHVAQNSGNNEWYTPKEFIEAARESMGGIDLDPASSDIANKTVKADNYFTKETNGLDHYWFGRIWMNPPYAQPLIGQFADKLKQEVESGGVTSFCVLVNNATETKWFKAIASVADYVCFTSGRVKFLNPQGEASGAPLQGQAALIKSDNIDSFKGLGLIMKIVK